MKKARNELAFHLVLTILNYYLNIVLGYFNVHDFTIPPVKRISVYVNLKLRPIQLLKVIWKLIWILRESLRRNLVKNFTEEMVNLNLLVVK